jgi:hypothetical protein
MMNFIRKIVEKKQDHWVHKQFTRYGMGSYEYKALLEVKKGKKRTTIKTGFEFAGEFAYRLAESIQGKTHVKGGLIIKKDIKDLIDFELAGLKQFAGVKTHLIDTELSKEQVQGLFEKFPDTLILLSFKTDLGELKTKVKAPKPPKKKKEEEPKADFCSLKTTDEELIKDLTFDVDQEFAKVRIVHTLEITDLEIPKEYENDPAQARINAIRKGTLIREITVEDNKVVKKYPLEA